MQSAPTGPPDLGQDGRAELSYATRGLQSEVAHLLVQVDSLADPAIQRLAASVRERSDLLSMTRRQLADDPEGEAALAVFDLREMVSRAARTLSGESAGVRRIATHLPDAPTWVIGRSRVASLALSRTLDLFGEGLADPNGAEVELSLTRAGVRLDLMVPGVQLPARSLVTLVEAFMGSITGPSSAARVNVQVAEWRVNITTDAVTAATAVDKTTVTALWRPADGILSDAA